MFELIVVAICIFINAFLAAVEMAFVKVSKPKLRALVRSGHAEAQTLLRLKDRPERSLAVVQIGISLVGALAAAVSGAGVEESLAPLIETKFAISEPVAEAIAILFVIIPLTYFTIVVGELLPKSLAFRHPERLAFLGARFLTVGEKILGPFVTALEKSTVVLLRTFFARAQKGHPPVETFDESMIEKISTTNKQYLLNLVDIDQKNVRDILLPWQKVDVIYLHDAVETVLQKVIACGHTRLPVVDNTTVVGVLHSKEFLSLINSGLQKWNEIIRPTLRVPENMKLLDVLRKLQGENKHMAIVEKSKEPIGIVTLEDIMEEVFGDIYDEDDDGVIKKIVKNKAKKISFSS